MKNLWVLYGLGLLATKPKLPPCLASGSFGVGLLVLFPKPLVFQAMDYSLIPRETRQVLDRVQAVRAHQAQPTPATV